MSIDFCCPMRAKYLIGIVAENADLPIPIDVVDFQDFDSLAPDGRPILKIRYCPFCGKLIHGVLRVEDSEPRG